MKQRIDISTVLNGAPTPKETHDWCPPLDRRAALRLISMSAVAAMAGCSGSKSASTGTQSTTATLSASNTSVAENSSVTLTATISPSAATGTVTFYDGSTSLGAGTVSSGGATLKTAFTTAGTHTLSAVYGGDSSYAASTSASLSITVLGTTCSETLEGEEGPYSVDDSASGFDRSNILSNLDGSGTQSGVPFTLTIYVYDSGNGCSAMEGVQVDIWHCNASGIYSDESSESTSGQNWLRGYQLSDTTGKVEFTTIIPGWYSGRTTHIHLRLRSTYDSSDTGGSNTMQVFFPQSLIDTLSTSVSPYSSEGTNPTTNASDRVDSQQENGTTLLTVSGNVSEGYSATCNVYLPIA